jgi:redox-sensing transcriptional repressor
VPSVPPGVDVRKVDLSIELQILAFHEQRKLAPGGRVASELSRDLAEAIGR